ncbi:MAG: nucleotidyl transferase AbiEii/AbiGii toxin family protein [Candidatus Margulisbacteria bacterium]|nr:nucleotidyl transferase AbiEii/AbiGii toxin family protein [Candidatus Margulisiibacteriota bacterium]
MKKPAKNIPASVRARLQNIAAKTGRPFFEVLQYYAMERFLYRFSQSEYADQFILKGALMFTVWQVPERRTTLDIDFSARFSNKVAAIEDMIKDVCKVPVDPDGLVFNASSVKAKKIKENADYEGVRVKFHGLLGRSRVTMQIDVAFGDTMYPAPGIVDYPVILDLPRPRLKGYPVESVVSEKFEAAVKLGSLNSRMKDFYDLWLMMRRFDFNGLRLTEALKRTFRHRKSQLPEHKPLFAEEMYDKESDRQTLWKAFLKKGEIEHAPEKLSKVAHEIEKFLVSPLEAISKGQGYDKEWMTPGPWK